MQKQGRISRGGGGGIFSGWPEYIALPGGGPNNHFKVIKVRYAKLGQRDGEQEHSYG